MKHIRGHLLNRYSLTIYQVVTNVKLTKWLFQLITSAATNLSNSYSNDMLTVKLSGIPDMHWRDLFTSTRNSTLHIIILYSNTFYKKGHVIRRNLKIPNARVSRFVDCCAVMTLESFYCVLCQSKEFDRVTDWLEHSLQAIVVYVKYLFMFQNDYTSLGYSVICSIDYWLFYINRKFNSDSKAV